MSESLSILFGGVSPERRVSVASAQNIASAVKAASLLFIDPQGKVSECSRAQLEHFQRPFEIDFEPTGKLLFGSLAELVKSRRYQNTVMVLALHGGEGEDGTLQKLFEDNEILFTGSGSAASKKAFDKHLAKQVARKSGILVAEEMVIPSTNAPEFETRIREWQAEYHRIILKPNASGSSFGLFRIDAAAAIPSVMEQLKKQPDTSYLIEPFLQGTEVTVGVYQKGNELIALPPSEVRTAPDATFDYEGKYLGKAIEITPAEIGAPQTELVKSLSLNIHRALGCEGYSRTDIILTPKGAYFLELNTLPGLTRASFLPQQLQAANLSFSQFCSDQILLARARSASIGNSKLTG